MTRQQLPDGVRVLDLIAHRDERGVFTELYREQWETGVAPIQWNAVQSNAGVLRGVHVHSRHDDYLTMAAGRMTLGLCDLRPGSATHMRALTLEIAADQPRAVAIPPGVAHGFYFPEPSVHVYAVSHYWDAADELGCRWDDPGLGIPWAHSQAQLSERDEQLQPLDSLVTELAAAMQRTGGRL